MMFIRNVLMPGVPVNTYAIVYENRWNQLI